MATPQAPPQAPQYQMTDADGHPITFTRAEGEDALRCAACGIRPSNARLRRIVDAISSLQVPLAEWEPRRLA